MAEDKKNSSSLTYEGLAEMFARRDAEYNRRHEETERQIKETNDYIKAVSAELSRSSADLKKSLKKLGKQIGGQGNRWGKIVEDLVAGDLIEVFAQLGVEIEEVSTRYRGKYQGQRWEIDILAINSGSVVIAEVKTTLKKDDIDYFVEQKLLKLTELAPRHKGNKIYGALAFVKAEGNQEEIVRYALDKGLVIIKAMKGTNHLINPKDYRPRNFHP